MPTDTKPILQAKNLSTKPAKVRKEPVTRQVRSQPEPTVQPVAPVTQPVTPVESTDSTETEIVPPNTEANFIVIRENLSGMIKEVTDVLRNLKNFDADLKKLANQAKREINRKRRVSRPGNSSNGFNALVNISSDLANLLNLPEDTLISRPKVTSLISQYADDNGLKKPDNKTIFLPDDKLRKIFGPPIHLLKKNSPDLGTGYGIFNINTYLKRHYTKVEKPVVIEE